MGLDTSYIHPDSQAITVDMCAKGASGRPHSGSHVDAGKTSFSKAEAARHRWLAPRMAEAQADARREHGRLSKDASRGFAPDPPPARSPTWSRGSRGGGSKHDNAPDRGPDGTAVTHHVSSPVTQPRFAAKFNSQVHRTTLLILSRLLPTHISTHGPPRLSPPS